MTIFPQNDFLFGLNFGPVTDIHIEHGVYEPTVHMSSRSPDMNFGYVTHRQKVMYKSPPCICTGGLKKIDF